MKNTFCSWLIIILMLALLSACSESPTDATPASSSSDTDLSSGNNTNSSSMISSSSVMQISECNDGIDNDGDGFVDYVYDQGCYGPGDADETAGTREEEDGWTTYDLPEGVPVYYVSADGDDNNSGLSPDSAMATYDAARKNHVEGESMWILFRRGDEFDFDLSTTSLFGESPENPVLLSTYGEKLERPVLWEGGVSAIKSSANVSVIGFHSKPREPFRDYEGTSGGGVTGDHRNYLIEDFVVDYGYINFQAFGDGAEVSNMTLRRSVIRNAYNTRGHSSGMFTSKVDGLLIEENIFDHNGWLIQQIDEGNDQEDGQATFFNHNMYLSSSKNITVRNNFILRGASMGIKMRCDVTGCTENVLIENNVFAEGEIGVGIGGNTDEPYRFVNPTIRNNAFLGTGRTHPTNRDISWALSVSDNRNLEVSHNLFAHQDTLRNSFAMSFSRGLDGAVIRDNVIYGINDRAIRFSDTGWIDVEFNDNIIHDSPLSESYAFEINDNQDGDVSFSGNHIFSNRPEDENVKWLGDYGTFDEYKNWSGDAEATTGEIDFTDPTRSLISYNTTLGGQATIEDFVEQAIGERSRFGWNPDYEAQTVLDYLFAGFDM